MTPLFKRAAVFTDIHFGRKNNDKVHNNDCLDYIDWFISVTKERNADCVIFCGDYFDNRHSIQISTLHAGILGLERLNTLDIPIYFLLGNHDLVYKDQRTLSSVIIAKKYNNIKVFYDIETIGGVTFCPWLVHDEWKLIQNLAKKSTYIFGHFELPTFMMNAMVEMPESPDGLDYRHFDEVDQWAFTGHFHKKQSKGRVIYMGNTFPHNFADVWDDDRGMMLLDWCQKPEFLPWPHAPSYKTVQLSELMDNPEAFLQERVYARVTSDLGITHNQSQLIRDIFQIHFTPRRIEILDPNKGGEALDFDDDPTYKTVDQLVIEGLNNVDSSHLDKKLLVDLYLGL